MKVSMEATCNYVVQLGRKAHAQEDGQDMIEYALLAALISIAAIAVIILVGPALSGLFQHVTSQLASV